SDARRTFLVSSGAAIVALALSAIMHALGMAPPDPSHVGVAPLLANQTLWAIVAVALATVSSWVLFGLREQVREARRLGQYTLLETLGEGGMGAVWRARHALLRRPTAVKLLPPDKAAASSVARFEREVQLTASLLHPNIVTVFDYGRTPDGVFYYAMEYLE